MPSDPAITVDQFPPYPQTLEISFDVAAGVSEIQIALMWEGTLSFRPDALATMPVNLTDVRESSFAAWNTAGTLLLGSYGGFMDRLGGAFATHLPLITPAPDFVVYSKVRLTKEFIFTTLKALPSHRFVLNGTTIGADDPQFHEKRIMAFLRGLTSVFCAHHATDPAQDTTMKSMPSVLLAAPGTRTTLRVTTGTLAPEYLLPTWFDQVPAYDDLSGQQLVDPRLRNLRAQFDQPMHPGHSVLPTRLVFQAAASPAFAPDHPPASALRAALAAPLAGTSYRRLELVRPPLPGETASSVPRRPYPAYKLCWKKVGAAAAEELRLPLSGTLYLALEDATYKFWVLPRSGDSTATVEGDAVRLSQKSAAVHYIGWPQTSLSVDVTGQSSFIIYSHIQNFDAQYAWERFVAAAPGRGRLKARAAAYWNADVLDWYLDAPHMPRTAHRNLAPIYGYFREAAGRHGLSPEFLQVIFFGEGGAGQLGGFSPAQTLDAYTFVGLDLIVYRTGRLPAGRPAVPPEVPAGAAEERAEYAFNLVTNGYVDPATAAAVSWDRTQVRAEAGGTRTLEVGTIAGWPAAIDLVAAELHARLDEMVAFCAAHVPPIDTSHEVRRRFLSYVRFNAGPVTARTRAGELAPAPAPSARPVAAWVGARLNHNLNVLYNTIQRLAVTHWHEEVGAYRSP